MHRQLADALPHLGHAPALRSLLVDLLVHMEPKRAAMHGRVTCRGEPGCRASTAFHTCNTGPKRVSHGAHGAFEGHAPRGRSQTEANSLLHVASFHTASTFAKGFPCTAAVTASAGRRDGKKTGRETAASASRHRCRCTRITLDNLTDTVFGLKQVVRFVDLPQAAVTSVRLAVRVLAEDAVAALQLYSSGAVANGACSTLC